jgi:translation initiation factor IF-1
MRCDSGSGRFPCRGVVAREATGSTAVVDYRAAPTRGRPIPWSKGAAAIAVKEEKIEMEGEIVESLRSGMFRIRLDNGHEMLGYTAGRMKRHRIRMGPGDRVRVEVSAYDLDRGRIVYRLR